MKIQKFKNSKIALIGFVLLFVGALGFVSCEKESKKEDDMPFKISKVLDKEVKYLFKFQK